MLRNVILGMIGVYILLALQFRGYLALLTQVSHANRIERSQVLRMADRLYRVVEQII